LLHAIVTADGCQHIDTQDVSGVTTLGGGNFIGPMEIQITWRKSDNEAERGAKGLGE